LTRTAAEVPTPRRDHGDAAKLAKLVGKSERLVSERIDLLRLPEDARSLIGARHVPVACARA
jgi:hypothetical protein